MPSLFYLISERRGDRPEVASVLSVEVLPTAADLASVVEARAADAAVLQQTVVSRADALRMWETVGGLSAADALAHLQEQERRAGA